MNDRNTSATLAYYWGHTWRYKWLFLGTIFFVIVSVFLDDILVPLLTREFVNLLEEGGGEEVIVPGVRLILLIFGVKALFVFVTWRASGVMFVYFTARAIRNIADDCFGRLHAHSYKFFVNNFTGGLVSKVRRMYHSYDRIINIFVFQFLRTVIQVVFISILLLTVNVVFLYIMLGWLVIYILMNWRFSVWKMKYDIRVASSETETTAELADSISNALTVKIFSRFGYEKKRFESVLEKKERNQRVSWLIEEVQMGLNGFSMILIEVLVFWNAVVLYGLGRISLGTIIMLQSVFLMIFRQFWSLERLIRDFYRAMADTMEMVGIIKKVPEVRDVDRPEKCRMKKGEIEFRGVEFGYGEGEKVFNDLSFKIKAGRKVGIVGESGAGKTTLTKLLLRFMDVDKGQIYIDGQDIGKVRQDDLRKVIAFVPQDPILFHRSLEENIRYGNLGIKKGEIIEAAKKAHADVFINKLEDGYETLVGERGIKLSGGERQRIAIARAIVSDSPILVLDEATSSLDSRSERLIQDALHNLMEGRTAIVIAHRLSTLREMDEIIVFEGGRIVERGNHKSLVHKRGKYAELWNHQVGGFLK